MSARTPLLRHFKPRNLAFVQIKGRRYYLGKWGSAAAQESYGRIVQRISRGEPFEDLISPRSAECDNGLTVIELLAAYWRHAKRQMARLHPSRLEYVRGSIRRLRRTHGHTPVRDFGPLAFAEHRTMAITSSDRPLSRRFVNEHMRRICRAFRWAASQEMIPTEWSQRLTEVEALRRGSDGVKEPGKVKPVDRGVVEATLKHMPDIPSDMVRLQLATGMRPGEVCRLTPGQLDRDGKLAEVEGRTIRVWLARFQQHKTARHRLERIVPIGPVGQSILAKYLLRPDDEPCFQPRESERRRRKLATATCGEAASSKQKAKPTRRPGSQYRTDTYRNAAQRAAARAGVTKWSPYQLRHTAATDIRRVEGLEAAQIALGHTSRATTEIYAEPNLEPAIRAAAKLG